MLPEISEQLLFPIDINIYTLICLSSGGNKLEETILCVSTNGHQMKETSRNVLLALEIKTNSKYLGR